MASRQQGLKRKSEDFISELSENDLSANESVELTLTELQIIDEENEIANQMKKSSSKEIEASKNTEKISQLLLGNCEDTDEQKIQNLQRKKSDDFDVLDIHDMDNSVEIVERNISVMELSDEETIKCQDATHEEGKILEVFEVVDENEPTPLPDQKNMQSDDPFINISFKNEEIKKNYEYKFVKLLGMLSEFKLHSEDHVIHDLHPDNSIHKTPKKKLRKEEVEKELFVFDTNPSLNESYAELSYSNKFTIEDKKAEEEIPQKECVSAHSCFNCGGGHGLNDCTLPKNFDKINAARQKFASNKFTRYHVDEDQKYEHFKPGVISENLRNALGLMKNEVPGYIYRMRVLGYPPDKKAEVEIPQKKCVSAHSCFNCGGGHGLNGCTLPKNFDKINAARQKFASNKFTRYHVDEDQKYEHFKPGVISENLRNALGLMKNEVPGYIYRMRVVGYPPGWLKAAEIVNCYAESRYSNKFTIEDKKAEEEIPQKKCVSAHSCFNCRGGHGLNDCTLPKNFDKINAARQKFTSNKNSNKFTRYHVDEDQKYERFKPGVISENLRNALGLLKNEMPGYIYRMRVVGYPPGWLKAAEIIHSSLSMFNIDGGKVKNNNKQKMKGLDPAKIIDYPGFNAPLPKGFRDDFRKYRVHPYSKKLDKCYMLKYFENMCEENDSETSDMELDDNQAMTNRKTGEIMQEHTSCDSSLIDLENQKKNIINQLNTSNNETNQNNDDNSENNDSDSCESGEEEDQTIISIKESTLGTPIIETGSSYMRLPNLDNFSIGVSPVIDFENLPNSTGKYEKMTGVLSEEKELFVLDTNPSLNDSNAELRYSNKFIIEDKKAEEEIPQKKCVSVHSCFNCGEGHGLNDCTLPKNFDKINAARQKFASNKNSNKFTRYHVDEDQKYEHFKPGVISENLRNALGLLKNEVPGYIYRMRVVGYPPGWLKAAEIIHSSLSMFNIDGGKVKNNNKQKMKGLDPAKIIDYLGFNAPLPKGFRDDFRKYRVHPYSKKLDKCYMLKYFENMCEENDSETSDMELDDNQAMTNRKTGEIMEEHTSCDSSLEDLENQKINIINQLNTSYNETNQNNDDNSENNDSNSCESGEEEDQTIISIKESTLGTPIIETGSSYMRLPNLDNFSIGVSPVIDFENLPNSTGKYEKMTGVLSKVRSTMKNLGTCKS